MDKEILQKLTGRKFQSRTLDNLIKETEDLLEENKQLKEQLDEALSILANDTMPCELDGFMDKNIDYCSRNCGVDEEIYKQCWLRYIDQKRGINNG